MKSYIKNISLGLIFGITVTIINAQTTIKGFIEDPEFNESLVGATVLEKGTTNGTITDFDGKFELTVQNKGSVNLIVTYIGYEDAEIPVQVQGREVNLGLIRLNQDAISLLEINVIADRAKERETPVAFSTIRSKELEQQLGSRDIPLILNVTPSVYATAQGGGAGDARINVRGFDQRNVAIMINGVPVNDMENGWVYWSNWDGIADFTESIQLQRGLSATNLATPSIGGTMNIISSPSAYDVGGKVKFEYGSGNFMKTTVLANTGLINDRWAISLGGVRKIGEGIIDKTWTDAWAYYMGSSFKINKNHRLELFAMGAPQRHGQNLYKQNAAAYSHDYARELGAADSTLLKYPQSGRGRLYNQNWNTVNSKYSGKQFWNGKEHDRHDKGFINERENYFHKPMINLNWYARWADNISHYTTLYYSGGNGGGSGIYGGISWDKDSEPSRIPDWETTIATNSVSDTAYGIIRNSVNNQWQLGALSKVRVHFTENLKGTIGIDWRTAKIEHFREVRDLLGGQFFVYTGNEFDTPAEYNKQLGDKIGYHFTNTVDWFGYYLQMEYNNEYITAYGTFGNSFIKYGYTNHFVRDEKNTEKELSAKSDLIAGYQIKGGLSYRFFETFSVYGNFGYISKVPIFDNVINDQNAVVTENPKNEIFNALEIGANYLTPGRNVNIRANYYFTTWTDRANLRRITNQDGTEGYVFLKGLDALHKGFEIEVDYKPVKYLAIGGFASIGTWIHTDDVSGTYKDYDDTGIEEEVEYNLYIKDLKVGDAPQTQLGINATVMPTKGLQFQIDLKHNSKHFAAWSPSSRTDEGDRDQVWETPSYMVLDLHASYNLPLKGKIGVEVFAHVFNLLDEMYIQDATDNSKYNGFYGHDRRYSHTVNSAEIFLGIPRTFNVGAKVSF